MIEKRDANYYDEHRDDPELWEEVEEAPETKKRSGLGATICVRLSEEEARAIRQLAKNTNQTYSDIVRRAVINYLRPQFTIRQGVIQQSFSPPADIRQAAEQVVVAEWNRDESETTTTTPSQVGSKAKPAKPL